MSRQKFMGRRREVPFFHYWTNQKREKLGLKTKNVEYSSCFIAHVDVLYLAQIKQV